MLPTNLCRSLLRSTTTTVITWSKTTAQRKHHEATHAHASNELSLSISSSCSLRLFMNSKPALVVLYTGGSGWSTSSTSIRSLSASRTKYRNLNNRPSEVQPKVSSEMWIFRAVAAHWDPIKKVMERVPNDSNVKMLQICSITPSKKGPYHAGFQKTPDHGRNSYTLKCPQYSRDEDSHTDPQRGQVFRRPDYQSCWPGLSEEEALANLKKGLEEHYQILLEMAPKGRKVSFLNIELAEMSFSLLFRKSNSSFSEAGGNPPSRCTDAAGTRDSKIWSSRTNRM